MTIQDEINSFINNTENVRKRRLIALACCKKIERFIVDKRSKDLIENFELFVDNKITREELRTFQYMAEDASNELWHSNDNSNDNDKTCRAADAITLLTASGHSKYYLTNIVNSVSNLANSEEIVEILRDICTFLEIKLFCNGAKNIAQQVYDGDEDARFVLSDYLEENNYPEEIVLHLKSGTHYKGCWLIDQILGNS